jgi:5-(carboxyamino)imidazole ribonucleotide synthase
MTDRYSVAFADRPEIKYHSYAKSSRPGRKVGHVTGLGDELDDVVARTRAAAGFFQN